MENGKWKMENGKLKMENGKLKMESGKWTVVIPFKFVILAYACPQSAEPIHSLQAGRNLRAVKTLFIRFPACSRQIKSTLGRPA